MRMAAMSKGSAGHTERAEVTRELPAVAVESSKPIRTLSIMDSSGDSTIG